MSSFSEKIHIYYEIALSISTGPDLASIAKRTLHTILKRLNCSAGAIYNIHEDANNGLHFRNLVSIPRNTPKNTAYLDALSLISKIDPNSIANGLLDGLPVHGTSEGNFHYYLIGLPFFGIILLLKAGNELPPDLLKDLMPLNQKLAEACNAWISNQQLRDTKIKLQEAHDLLEARVIERTGELVEAIENLNREKKKTQKYLAVAGVMLVALNESGEITLINQKGCEILQTSVSEAIGQNWFDHYLPKRMAEEIKCVFSKVVSGDLEQVEYYENPVLTTREEEKIIAFHNTVLVDENGKKNGIIFSGEDITARKKSEIIQEALIEKLQKSLEEIKTLRGIIPICAYCKEIRDDKGSWNKLEKYISEHTEAQFSHGICEKCFKKYYPEEVDENPAR